MRMPRWLLMCGMMYVGYTSFTACSLAVDLDYLQDRACPSDKKLCNDACVTRTNPNSGCGAESCVPCTLDHATSNCANNGLCAIAGCLMNWRDCDRFSENGCEIDTDHDPNHCGSCSASPCVTPNAEPDCAAGSCAIRSCNQSFGDCNRKASDGCESDLRSDPMNCKTCGTVCASGTCTDGQCQ